MRPAGRARAAGVGEQVVEAVGALAGLQPVDHGEARVVAEHGDERDPGERRGVELGVQHQVGAVAEDRGDQAVRVGQGASERGAPRRGDLVAHAGEAVLEVHGGARGGARSYGAGAPAAVQLAGHPPGGGEHVVVGTRGVVDDPGDLGVGERPVGADAARAQPVDGRVPGGPPARRAGGPRVGGRPAGQSLAELQQRLARVAHHGQGAVLDRVEAGGVDGHDPHVGGEAGPRGGGEVLQPGADGQHHVGLGREVVGAGRAHDAQRPAVQAVVMRHQRAAGDRLDDGDAMGLGEGERLRGRAGVAHAAPEDEQRSLCPPQDLGGRGEVAPGVTPSQQMMYATESQLRLAGYDEGVVANALELRRDFEAWVHQPQPARELEARLSAAADEDWFGVLFLPPLLLDEEGRRLWIEEMDFDPRPVFARVRVPTLALWGGDDSWTPVAPSVEAWQQACGSVETIVLPNVEHDLTRPDGTFTEEFDHRLVEWLSRIR